MKLSACAPTPRRAAIATLALLPLAGLLAAPLLAQADRAHVLELLREVPVIDGHNDVPWQYRSRAANHLARIDFRDTSGLEPAMHTDLARLARSGIGGQFWSVYIPAELDGPGAARAVLEQIDVVHRLAAAYPDRLAVATSADDIVRLHAQGKVASLIGMEGGHSIESSLAVLRQLHRAGARYMTLTHSENIAWADASTDDPAHGGLTEFGRQVVREMNRIGMLVDLSHVAASTMHDALDATRAPVIFSHSSAFALTAHPRNVPDDVLKRLPENGGVVMVTFVPPFVSETVRAHGESEQRERDRLRQRHDEQETERRMEEWRTAHPAPRATLADVAGHIDHVRATAGVDHVGIGSDFDGITEVPTGLEDVSKIPDLFVELLRRGYTDEEVQKIAGGNLLRAMREAERVSWSLSDEPPRDDLITELDGPPAEPTGGTGR
jgi:membrane dipeptidase